MKTKAKHGFRWGSLRFIGVWVLGYIAAWVASLVAAMTFSRLPLFEETSVDVLLMLVALGPIMTQAIAQKWVTRRGLGRDMRGWLRASLVGGILSGGVINIMQRVWFYPFSSDGGFTLFLLLWLALPAVVQAWWLRQRVKNAWLWAGAAAVNALLFTLPMQ